MSLHLVLMRCDDWQNHHGVKYKPNNQHVKQEHNRYIIKCNTKRVYKLHLIPTMGELDTHDDEYKMNMEKHPSFHILYKLFTRNYTNINVSLYRLHYKTNIR